MWGDLIVELQISYLYYVVTHFLFLQCLILLFGLPDNVDRPKQRRRKLIEPHGASWRHLMKSHLRKRRRRRATRRNQMKRASSHLQTGAVHVRVSDRVRLWLARVCLRHEDSQMSVLSRCFDSGLITPGGFSSVPAGMETPELIELRKKKIEEAMDGWVSVSKYKFMWGAEPNLRPYSLKIICSYEINFRTFRQNVKVCMRFLFYFIYIMFDTSGLYGSYSDILRIWSSYLEGKTPQFFFFRGSG